MRYSHGSLGCSVVNLCLLTPASVELIDLYIRVDINVRQDAICVGNRNTASPYGMMKIVHARSRHRDIKGIKMKGYFPLICIIEWFSNCNHHTTKRVLHTLRAFKILGQNREWTEECLHFSWKLCTYYCTEAPYQMQKNFPAAYRSIGYWSQLSTNWIYQRIPTSISALHIRSRLVRVHRYIRNPSHLWILHAQPASQGYSTALPGRQQSAIAFSIHESDLIYLTSNICMTLSEGYIEHSRRIL